KIVDLPGGSVATDAAEFDVDNPACAKLNGGARVLDVVNALVQANRSFELALQRSMRVNIVVTQRLLDHDQIKGIQLLQQVHVFQGVGGISVNHQANLREAFTKGAHRLHILAGLDLDFDALVACRKFLFYFRN